MSAKIREALRPFGITGGRHGFPRVVRAIELVLEDEDRLYAVTKQVYATTGNQLGCSEKTVERNIRSAVNTAWHRDRSLLAEYAGYSLTEPPTSSEFLEIMSNYIQRSERKRNTAKGLSHAGKG